MILLLLLVSLFAVGCGDSGEDFVVVGNNANNNNPQVPTTTVNFQFAQAQQVNITANVPLATTRLHIDFLASDSREVFETEVDFSPAVSVSGVPITATQAQVTALDRNGIPLRTIFYSLTLTAGQTANAVPLGPGFPVTFESVTASPNPLSLGVNSTQQLILSVNFSNGNSLSGSAAGGTATFTSAKPTVANVTSTGLVRGVTNGTATVNVTYSLNNVTKNSTVSVTVGGSGGGGGSTTGNTTGSTTGNTSGSTTGNTTGTTTGNTTGGTAARLVVSPKTLVLLANSATASGTDPLRVTFFAANSTVPTLLPTSAYTVTFSGANPAGTENRYRFYDPDSNPATLNSVFGTDQTGGAAEGNTVTATVSAVRNGVTVSDTISITVGNSTQTGAIISSEVISVAGSSLRLPKGTAYPFVVLNVAANGARSAATFGTAANNVSFDPTSITTLGTTPGNTPVLTLGGAAGSGTVILRRTNASGSGTTNFASIPLTIEDTTIATTNNVVLAPAANTIAVGSKLIYRVNLVSANGSIQDITPVWTVASNSTASLAVDTDPTVTTIFRGFATGVASNASVQLSITNAGATNNFVPVGTVAIGGTPANVSVTP